MTELVATSLYQARRACARLRYALSRRSRRQAEGFARLRETYYRRFWEEAARGAGADVEDAGDGMLTIHRNDRRTFVKQHEVMADSRLGLRVAGNKPFVLRTLGRHGCPTPRHVECRLTSLRRAEDFLRGLGRPVVVKPASGAGGHGVTTGITTLAGLRRAARWASAFSPSLVVEEQLPGHSYRLLYLDGCLIDVVRRDPPVVVGDGTRSIRNLIAEENARRLGGSPVTALNALRVDLDCRLALRALGVTLQDVPTAGTRLVVKRVTNENSSREQHSERALVHRSIVQTGSTAAAALGLNLVGIDIVTPDIGVPLGDSGGAIIEINTTPGLHHHALVSNSDDAVPVGAIVLGRLLAGQAEPRSVQVGAVHRPACQSREAGQDRPAPPASSLVHVSPDMLRRFALRVVRASGARGLQAEIFVKALVWSDIIGRPSHGVWRLGTYCQRVRRGVIKCPCRPVFRQTGAATGVLDGDRGFGLYIGHVAMTRAVELAKHAGTGVVCVANSNHFGTAGYYVQLAAERGMIGLAMSNSTPRVAAFGGAGRVFGTNPLAFGAPQRQGRTVLVDMATSARSGGYVIECMEKGTPLDPDVALDPDGRPTTDATLANQGALLPFGGAKGYGLALMVDILSGVLSGAGVSHEVRSMFHDFEASGNNGHVFVAIDVAHFMSIERFYDRLETLLDFVRQSGPNHGARVSIPGEGRWAARDRALREGIPLDRRIVAALEQLADAHDIPTPWRGVPGGTRTPSPVPLVAAQR